MKTIVIGTLLLLLGACGFRPMMGSGALDGDIVEQMGAVEISEIKDHIGQQLRNMLIDRFYHNQRSGKPKYRLDVILNTKESALTIEKDATATGGLLISSANYRLVHIASGKIVLQGFSNAVPGYKISNYQWASFVSQADAAERGIEYMSNDIRSRVALYFARAPDQKPPMARD
ncbi:MAG: hypothetical protein WCO00_14380 [Rhodospirillaceae bacterium]